MYYKYHDLQCNHPLKIVVANQRPPIVTQGSTPGSIFVGAVDASRPLDLAVTSIRYPVIIEAVGDAEVRHQFGAGCSLNDVIGAPMCFDSATCCTAATICAGRCTVDQQIIVRSCGVHCIAPVTSESRRRLFHFMLAGRSLSGSCASSGSSVSIRDPRCAS